MTLSKKPFENIVGNGVNGETVFHMSKDDASKYLT